MLESTNIYAGVCSSNYAKLDRSGKIGVFVRAAKDGEWKHALDSVQAFKILVHPDNPEVVLVGTNDGVWRSTDRGVSFKQTDFPDTKKEIWSFLVDKRDPKRILAGAAPVEVYSSDDMGASWRKLSTPKTPEHIKSPFATRLMQFAQHPQRPDEIFAALEINGVIHSADGGETWTDRSDHLIKLAQLPHLRDEIFSGNVAEGMLDAHSIAINPNHPDDVIVALRTGLFHTEDQGRTGKIWRWGASPLQRLMPTTYRSHRVNRLLSMPPFQSRLRAMKVNGTIMALTLHAHDPAQAYICGRYDGEVFGTQDGGETWQAMPLPGEVQHTFTISCG
ncbi:Sortilin, N-terminal [Fusarium oxysporum f. sp. vasinfectum]|nr:Sortilin, N-terminal [Fusarium oxysporum f. sp. vasinfectum]